ncbi:MAG TPA: TonB-dependent receptor [Brumimicrobium sp.]|nr:TonB-dependent receptor [Brumimicrobium sp.]
MKQTLLFLFLFSFIVYGQEITGKIVDENNEPIIGVLIESSDLTNKARSNLDGEFSIKVNQVPVTLTFTMSSFVTVKNTYSSIPTEKQTIRMQAYLQLLDGVVVSASRREQRIEEVPVSLEIISPQLIDNKALSSVEEAVNQAPGTYTMDGQVSIRGGSGFSYGAGSRVMVVWNDAPLISADAGDIKWESIALENISQIEVLKGASSVLYGSGALNGIVSLRDKEPTRKGEIKASYQIGMYDLPTRPSLQWSKKALLSNQVSVYAGKMYDQFGFTLSAYGFSTDGYRAGETAERGRVNGSFVFKPKKLKRFKAGLNYSLTMERKGIFMIWESDSLAYHPMDGYPDAYAEESTLSQMETFRAMVDPYATYYDKYDNKHSLQTRYYNTTNRSANNQGAIGNILYADYKFERKFKKDWTVTAGLTGNWGFIHSQLYGDHLSKNYSIYGQVEKSIGKFDFVAGVRGEYYQANSLTPDSRVYLSKDSTASIPVKPIFRVATHYKAAKYTHIRASFGQAYRFPSIAERFASTSVGALNIFPNANLQPESGWSAEIGAKQGFKIGNFKGFIDVAGFINEYKNMMEFTFGFYLPDSIQPSFNVNDPGYIGNWYGFRAENAERARIIGAELSINGTGKIGPIEITALLGYTYMNPIVLNPDSLYVYGSADGNGGLSNPNSNMLKYRFNHLAKGDIELKYQRVIFGFSGMYNSFMTNIDNSFENGVNILSQVNMPILAGLKEYRERNNKGDLVFDTRIGFEVNDNIQLFFIVNNLLNKEYMTRPGDIQAPRQFMLRIQAKF